MTTTTPRQRPEGPEDRAHRTGLITGLVIGVMGGGLVGGIVGAMAAERAEKAPVLGVGEPAGEVGSRRQLMGITERPVEERIPPAPAAPAEPATPAAPQQP
jgi:hypothetical protein